MTLRDLSRFFFLFPHLRKRAEIVMKVNPTEFDWTPATANVDPTQPFDASKEITGYIIGIRSTTAAGSAPGTYPISIVIADPKATKELLSAAYTAGLARLKDDTYDSSVRSTGPVNSDWAPESATSAFQILTPLPVPVPPSNFSAA